jgi:hypothetical protein
MIFHRKDAKSAKKEEEKEEKPILLQKKQHSPSCFCFSLRSLRLCGENLNLSQ